MEKYFRIGERRRFLSSYVRKLAVLIGFGIEQKAPAVWVALGALISFYGFAPHPRAVAVAALAIAGAAISVRPFTGRRNAFIRNAFVPEIVLFFCLGLIWGAAAVLTGSGNDAPEESARFEVSGFNGVVASDGYATASGNTIMTIELREIRIAGRGFQAKIGWPGARPHVIVVTDDKSDFGAGLAVDFDRPSAIAAEESLYFASGKNVVRGGFVSPAARLRSGLKKKLVAKLAEVSGRAFPLAQALLLGIREDIDSAEAALFRDAGCAHILSLSGQHLSILCMLMSLVCKRLLKRSDLADWASLAFALSFVWLVGASPSLFRSALMVLLSTVAKKMDRPQRGLTVLALSFCLALGTSPDDAHSLSFILSYSAMAGLIVLSSRWQVILSPLPDVVAQPVSTSLSALCATAIFSMSAFGSIALGGIVSSTLSGPIVLVFMWSLLGAILVGSALPFLNGVLSAWHEVLHSLMLFVLRLGAMFPPFRVESPAEKRLASAVIVLIMLFVYDFPYVEHARYEIARMKSAHEPRRQKCRAGPP